MPAVFHRAVPLVIVLAVLVCGASHASGWKPSKPVAFIVGAGAGGSLDLTARALQQIWDARKTVGNPIIVVDKLGAGNAIAWTYMNDKGADGHTIAIGTTNLVTNPITDTHPLSYKEVTPLAILIDDYAVYIVRADSTLKSMQDIVERLKKDPGALSVGISPGRGASNHTAVGVTFQAAGVRVKEMRLVVYKSAPESMTAVIGGEVDLSSVSASNVPTYLQAGRIRVLAVTAPKRLGGVLANIPTLRDQGINATFTNWRAVIGPKNMDKEAVAFCERALAEAVKTDEWRKEIERNFWAANFLSGDRARKFMHDEDQKFRAIWKEIGTTQ